jgi:hypothetical protein
MQKGELLPFLTNFGTAMRAIIRLDQGESLIDFRVCGVELSLPDPAHFGHRFLESPVPIVPSPWQSGQVTIQSSARS